MADCETTDELLALNAHLLKRSDMIGWLCTNHRHTVKYADAEAMKRIQGEVDIAAEFINVIYICALLEEADFRPSNKWIPSQDREEFQAWVHIRHTGAHVPDGRAGGYAAQFDAFMSSGRPGKSGLVRNCTCDANSITLSYGMSFHFFQFAKDLVNSALGHCANGNVPA